MKYPEPDDMRGVPHWENYIVAQMVQATIGLIPTDALAVGVRIKALDVELIVRFASEPDQLSVTDIHDIAEDFTDLVGPEVSLIVRIGVGSLPVGRSDAISARWIYQAHSAETLN